jgi:cellulose biosynthesis protein BcsQ
MKILAVTSGKGGVGKSTITLNVARQLSLSGKRTLLVDFDIHNKGITGLFLPKISPDAASVTTIVQECEGFAKRVDTAEVKKIRLITLTKDSGLLLLPASRPQEMIQWERFHAENHKIVEFFRSFLEELAQECQLDVIVIDCYGGIDSLTVAAAGIADDVIIVNEPDLITFSGTLQLYVYLRKQYEDCSRKPHIHFVVNRVTSRHSFTFLDREYRKHLANLAIDDKVLAYFPYDKLLIETFGDYPFFSELLPRGLFTKKIRVLIETLWKDDPTFRRFSGFTERRKNGIFRRTIESPFADPERIIRAVVTAPIWLIVPSALLFALSSGVGSPLHYRTVEIAYYVAIWLLLFLVAVIGVFEPIQISRWLWREASYHRRKRRMKHQVGSVYRFIIAFGEGFRAALPGLVGLVFLWGIVYLYWSELRNPSPLEIWPGELYGFSAHGKYQNLVLHSGAKITPGADMESVNLTKARMYGVHLAQVDLKNSNLDGAVLDSASIVGSNLDNVQFGSASLYSVHFEKSRMAGADFTKSHPSGVSFKDCDLTNADFTGISISSIDFDDSVVTGARFKVRSEYDLGRNEQKLRAGGAQIEVTSPKASTPPLPVSTSSACNADCEFERAWEALALTLPDLIESLILKGGAQNFNEAQKHLDELKHSPKFASDKQLQGHYLLLILLLRLTQQQPENEALKSWCDWLAQNRLNNWSWAVWDNEMTRKHFSREVREKIKDVEASAQRSLSPMELCARLQAK